ncbi:MAG TPA: (Fe-S)-binding protein [Ilumatobacteraceae bacterium]|nr:(Fe-S)-binding protein [Ilumatobacteraceae bacterium]
MDLGLDDDELSTCVACGLCLPHCPTFRATGEEGLSPRGRIDAMRAVQWRGAEADAEFVHFMETCVQCRGCEPACPSGVPFGRLMEHTRTALADARTITPRWQRIAFSALGHHRLLLVGSTLLALAQRVRLVPARLGLARLAVRRGRRPSDTGTDVWLFTGCVMDAWQRETHRATAEVMTAVGVTYAVPRHGGDCCGALHVHAGLDDSARRLATRVIASMPGDAPIVVNSAGCGAALKDYGHLLATDEAAAFSLRVLDVHEWLVPRLDRLAITRRNGRVIVQDPCHLRHVQRAHLPVREVLARVAEVVELDDEGLCCGAGGAYSALEPELAATIRTRKLGAIRRAEQRSGATVVASANPGCAMHLGAAGVTVRHPIDLVAEAIR